MKNETNTITIVLASFLILALIALFFNNSSGGFGMPCRDYGQYGSYLTYGFGWMSLFMLVIWALIIVALILGIIWLTKQIRK